MDPLNFESENQVKNISVALSSSQIKIWGKSVKGFMSYDRTHKQTNKQIDKQRFLLSNPTHAADTAN